jgi:hypothetical protein
MTDDHSIVNHPSFFLRITARLLISQYQRGDKFLGQLPGTFKHALILMYFA